LAFYFRHHILRNSSHKRFEPLEQFFAHYRRLLRNLFTVSLGNWLRTASETYVRHILLEIHCSLLFQEVHFEIDGKIGPGV
jgi:hypothetical protein